MRRWSRNLCPGYDALFPVGHHVLCAKDTEDVFVQTDGTMYFVNAASAVGALAAYVSSSSSETYPSDGISGSYWYTRLTSGSIDPTAVALASSPPVAGQSATIQVTPRSNSYGTISYLYQYSIDDGSTWTTIATRPLRPTGFTVPTRRGHDQSPRPCHRITLASPAPIMSPAPPIPSRNPPPTPVCPALSRSRYRLCRRVRRGSLRHDL